MGRKKKSVFCLKDGIKKTVKEYAGQATVHGISYISDSSAFLLDRFLWLLVCIIFGLLAIALSTKAYIEWQEDPVLTSVKTTG